MQIFKFGGASVKDANGIRNLCDIISRYNDQKLVVVISAMGKTTNKLEALVGLAVNGKDYREELTELMDYHQFIAKELLGEIPELYRKWENALLELLAEVDGADYIITYDKIIPHGELMSTSIIHAYLMKSMKAEWLDAREIIRTDQYFTEANVDWVVTERQTMARLNGTLKGSIVITQGFIGSDVEGNTTTLGREGSDFTGAILAYCLNADNLTVWKDVRGILNADPRIMNDTEQYHYLSYREVTEMTYYGAQVIHPKTLKPLAQKNIPLMVRSFEDHGSDGTLISTRNTPKTIPCFVFKGNQLLVTAEVKDHSFMEEKKLGMILQVLDLLNIKINLMQNSALTFSFCIDNKEFKAKRIKELLNRDFLLSFETDLNLATIKNYAGRSFEKLPREKQVIMEQKTAHNYQVLYRL